MKPPKKKTKPRKAARKAARRKAASPPERARPEAVKYVTIPGGRRRRGGVPAELCARIEYRNGECAVSLGMSIDKLQIRITLDALRKIVDTVDSVKSL